MRVVGRNRFVVAGLVTAVLAIIGWRYASRDPVEPTQIVSMTGSSSQIMEQSSASSTQHDRPSQQQETPIAPSDTGVLRGRVVDAATKAPIREFTIEFFARPASKPTPGARAFQTKDGRFEWTNVPADLWEITASAAGYQRFEVGEVLIRDGAATPEIVLPLRRGFRISGRVFDEFTSTGIENATVSFRDAQLGENDGDWRRREHANTDRNGMFVLDGVPAGRVVVSADSQDHASKGITISVGPDLAPLQIGLSAGGVISGRLTATDGITGVAGWINLSDLDRGTGSGAKSGPNGEFIHKNLSPGRYVVTGRSEGGRVDLELALGPSERRENLVLALKAGAVIRGTIRGLSADELRATNIIAHREPDAFEDTNAKVDSRGGYEISGLRQGRVRLWVNVANERTLNRVVDVPPTGDQTVDFDFGRGARLSGRITRGGKPWPLVPVQPESLFTQEVQVHRTPASREGMYVFNNLPHGDYRLNAGGYRTAVVRLDGDKVFDFDVPVAATFAGQVSETPSGVPIVGARVEVRAAENTTKLMPRFAETDHFGRFSLNSLQPGDYVVTVYKPDFEMYRERLSFGTATVDRAIRLQSDRGVRVRVRATNGVTLRTLEAAEVVGNVRVGRVLLALDEDGSAYLPSGLAGSSLSLRASGFEPVDIRTWNGRELDLRVVPRQAGDNEISP